MVAGSIPVRRSWTSLPGGLFLHHFEGGRLPLAAAALSAKHSGCHPREGGDLFCASKPSSATPTAGSSPQRPRPRSTNRCHARLRAGTSSFSSKRMVQQNVMLTIADCHADVTLNLIQGSIGCSLRSMFASSGFSHANTITSLKCLLCETPPLRKETREGLRYVMLPLGTC